MLKLLAKLLAVQIAKKAVLKNGVNTFHHYKYAEEADYIEMLQPILNENKLVITSSVVGSDFIDTHTPNKTGGDVVTTLCRVNMRFTIYDVESGESITADAPGTGQDSGDKAIYKAITGATKYFLAKFFLIPAGDDPEKEAPAAAQPVVASGNPFVDAFTQPDPYTEPVAPISGSGATGDHGICPTHKKLRKPSKTVGAPPWCPTKLPDGKWCKGV